MTSLALLDYKLPCDIWSIIRRQTLERDKYECRRCGLSLPKLDIHHIKIIREPDGRRYKLNNPENLISLCRGCHKKVEADRQRWEKKMVKIQYRLTGKRYVSWNSEVMYDD
jgi:5-methylcytosine-specific restriction endonuclease McrA